MSILQRTGELKFAVALGAALAISACAKAPDSLAALDGGRAAPGSPRISPSMPATGFSSTAI